MSVARKEGTGKFAVALVQMTMGTDPGENLEKGVERVREAARGGARVVCLPELFRSRYFCQTEETSFFDLAEPLPGPTTDALSAAARDVGVVVIAPVFERRASGVYHNSAAVIDADGSVAGVYRKMHIPDDPSFYEKFYFTPGDLGFRAFDTRAGRIGTMICWDQWYPEGARLTALAGASILFYPTAIGWHPREKEEHGERQRDAWRTVQRGTRSPTASTWRRPTGWATRSRRRAERGSSSGDRRSCATRKARCSPRRPDREEILLGEVDPARIEEVRRNWPFLRDRRIDAYAGITSRILDDEPWGKKR